MPEVVKLKRLAKAAGEFNVGISTIVEYLHSKGFEINSSPSSKLSAEMYDLLVAKFQPEKDLKDKAEKITLGNSDKEDIVIDREQILHRKGQDEEPVDVSIGGIGEDTKEVTTEKPKEEKNPAVEKTTAKPSPESSPKPIEKKEVKTNEKPQLKGPKVVGSINIAPEKPVRKKEETQVKKTSKEVLPPKKEETKKVPEKTPEIEKNKEVENITEIEKTKYVKLRGTKKVGKIELAEKKTKQKKKEKKPVATSGEKETEKKRRIRKKVKSKTIPGDNRIKPKTAVLEENKISQQEIEEKLRKTMAKITGGQKQTKSRKVHRKSKRDLHAQNELEAVENINTNLIEVTEFISVAELGNMLDVSPTQIIGVCLSLGIMVSINQRLNAEIIELVAAEFDHEVKFITISEQDDQEEEYDDPETLLPRPPIVTIMGHVDHGKTSLLDHIRNTNVIAGEKGGITQHIGAYEVILDDGKRICFLDTPGHEAFTAMRARGAKITDVAVIVVAADDNIMPQTKEAISHSQAAGVPMIFAINKIDKDNANAEKIKEQLAAMNLLVEDWGGKYQSQDISAKKGINIDKLMEKILLEAELLELKANPDKPAIGTVIEATLDKGRGYVTTVLVQEGTLKIGDMVLAGSCFGHVKAMNNERGVKIKSAGPSTPVQILGLNGAPQAGEKFRVYTSEQDAKSVAYKRSQIEREQGLRAQKHITLEEIGRRLALGNFRELNIIVKGDVDGSVEALSDSLLKLSTEEIQVNIVHKGVGQITESDILLASASDAIIVGFQVRPALKARKLAEFHNIELRNYSVIYDAIEEIKSALEGMLEPKVEEHVLGMIEIKEIFKITKVGKVAGCMVIDGKVNRNSKIHVVREGIVMYTGVLSSLKRFKDDVKEVRSGQDCGLTVKDYADLKVGDTIEAFEEIQIKRTLE